MIRLKKKLPVATQFIYAIYTNQYERKCDCDYCILCILSLDYKVDKRGKMHISNLRKLALKIHGLKHQDPCMMEFFTHQIKTLCNSILRDCCIEMNAEASVEDYPHYLFFHQRVSGDVYQKLKEICSTSERYTIEYFFHVVPVLIQAIKEIFTKENPSNEQNGLKGLTEDILHQHEANVKDALHNEDIFELVCEVCKILENLCLNNCGNQSTTEEIENWSRRLGIWNMLEFLKGFSQGRQESKLFKRLHVISSSLRDIKSKNNDFDVRDFYNVSLTLVKFAKFDPSKLVRFELTDSTNSPVTCFSEAIKYDRPRDTFSQQFSDIRKESEGELQLGAIAHVYLDGRIRKVGAFQSVIMLPPASEEKFNSSSIGTLPIAIKTERIGSENLRVVLYSTRKENISQALSLLQSETGDDTVDWKQVEITVCHLNMCCFGEESRMARLRLLYKWQSEAISVVSKDFVAFAESSPGDTHGSELQTAGR